ncbi:nucleoside-diphosphate kinase [Dehalococcoidia bacterium]|nr:nucleoside-diphosphate kinase [Dehalococcoidia bacterium]
MSDTQQTLVLIKPDAVQRGLAGEILSRLEQTGLKIIAMKLIQIDDSLARRHYAIHDGKPFFDSLIAFITSSAVVAMVLNGRLAVEKVRGVMGATDPAKAAPGSIRGDLGVDIERNLIHGSDGPETAESEISLFFAPEELVSYQRDNEHWITS